jgi:hypothetical protein
VKQATRTITFARLAYRESGECTKPENPGHGGELPAKNSQEYSKSCRICKEGVHSVDLCETFRKMEVRQRWWLADRLRLCYNCLNHHAKNECKSNRPCGTRQCGKMHHRRLHRDLAPQPTQHKEVVNVNQTATPGKAVLLSVVPVLLQGPKGVVTTSAFLDDASTISMVDADLAEQLGADGTN